MADNTVKINVGIDTSALADNLSQVKSLFQESTESITGLWLGAGEKITEALLKIVSQATETGQQSKEQMGGAASSSRSWGSGIIVRGSGLRQKAEALNAICPLNKAKTV